MKTLKELQKIANEENENLHDLIIDEINESGNEEIIKFVNYLIDYENKTFDYEKVNDIFMHIVTFLN